MLELLINPKKAERKPWEMLFIGFFYGSLSMILSYFLFAKDYVNSQYLGWILILFCVIFSMPFVYYTFKLEEEKDLEYQQELKLLEEHGRAILAFLFLFIGFVIAFSFWHMVLPNGNNLLKAQIETFCQINNPQQFSNCLSQYGIVKSEPITGSFGSIERFLGIFSNNLYVLIFTVALSLLFGAGAIFILAWNASVIAAAIGIFAKYSIVNIPLGFARYMVFHGTLEIAAYFIAALAGGIVSIAIIKHRKNTEKFWNVLEDSISLIIAAVIILVVAAAIEVYITPRFFS